MLNLCIKNPFFVGKFTGNILYRQILISNSCCNYFPSDKFFVDSDAQDTQIPEENIFVVAKKKTDFFIIFR